LTFVRNGDIIKLMLNKKAAAIRVFGGKTFLLWNTRAEK
jgi:hypothetical protein